MRVICASNVRQVRVNPVPKSGHTLQMMHTYTSNAHQVGMNLVPESARHLQITPMQKLRVDTHDLPEAIIWVE